MYLESINFLLYTSLVLSLDSKSWLSCSTSDLFLSRAWTKFWYRQLNSFLQYIDGPIIQNLGWASNTIILSLFCIAQHTGSAYCTIYITQYIYWVGYRKCLLCLDVFLSDLIQPLSAGQSHLFSLSPRLLCMMKVLVLVLDQLCFFTKESLGFISLPSSYSCVWGGGGGGEYVGVCIAIQYQSECCWR